MHHIFGPVLPTLPVTAINFAVDLVLAFLAIFSKASKTLLTFAKAIFFAFLCFHLLNKLAPFSKADLT